MKKLLVAVALVGAGVLGTTTAQAVLTPTSPYKYDTRVITEGVIPNTLVIRCDSLASFTDWSRLELVTDASDPSKYTYRCVTP